MHKHRRELLTHLFAEITARLEDAIEFTVAGQSAKATNSQLRSHIRQLAQVTDDLGTLIHAIAILIEPND